MKCYEQGDFDVCYIVNTLGKSVVRANFGRVPYCRVVVETCKPLSGFVVKVIFHVYD